METILGNILALSKNDLRKSGATKQDIAKIAELERQGKTSAEISLAVNVREDVVLNFMQPVMPVMDEAQAQDPAGLSMVEESEFAREKRTVKEKHKKR